MAVSHDLTIRLPPEVLIDSATYLDPQEISALIKVCKNWKKVFDSSECWGNLLKQRHYVQVSENEKAKECVEALFTRKILQVSGRRTSHPRLIWLNLPSLCGKSLAGYCSVWDLTLYLSQSEDQLRELLQHELMPLNSCIALHKPQVGSYICIKDSQGRVIANISERDLLSHSDFPDMRLFRAQCFFLQNHSSQDALFRRIKEAQKQIRATQPLGVLSGKTYRGT